MSHRFIVDQSEFDSFCEHVRSAGQVAFDTEFVSEFSYRPELCLLQFATSQQSAAVDPYTVTDLSRWWNMVADGEVEVVVHGGREEIRFCLRFAGRRPQRWADIQIAEGLESRSFPLSYSALVNRVLGARIRGRETRTDWRRRPLSDSQIAYALEDVEHVLQIWQKQRDSLTARNRLGWVQAEFDRSVSEVEQEQGRENWRRLPGILSLSPRELAVVRELFAWREKEAASRDRPARKMLRDDLIIDLARRQPRDVDGLLATRDMNRTDYRRCAPDMLDSIARGLNIPEAELPTVTRTEKEQDEQILAQLLSIALANRCSEAEVAMGLIGTTADLRHLVRWYVYGDRRGEAPRLTRGWRAEVCGDLLTDVLAGKIALRVSDPQSDHPLVFERLG
jgi:ribonuclease D